MNMLPKASTLVTHGIVQIYLSTFISKYVLVGGSSVIVATRGSTYLVQLLLTLAFLSHLIPTPVLQL